MTAWLPASSRLHLNDLKSTTQPLAGASQGLRKRFGTLREILSIFSRAQAAAHHYETLKRQSDIDLAGQGLERTDVPRAAFHKLTDET
jgi:hypothetical protein